MFTREEVVNDLSLLLPICEWLANRVQEKLFPK